MHFWRSLKPWFRLCLCLALCQGFVAYKEYLTPIKIEALLDSLFIEFFTPTKFSTNAIDVNLYRAEKSECFIFNITHKATGAATFARGERVRLRLPPLPCQGDVWVQLFPSDSYRDKDGNEVFPCLEEIDPLGEWYDCQVLVRRVRVSNGGLPACRDLSNKQLCHLSVPSRKRASAATASPPTTSIFESSTSRGSTQRIPELTPTDDAPGTFLISPIWVVALLAMSFGAVCIAVVAVVVSCIAKKKRTNLGIRESPLTTEGLT